MTRFVSLLKIFYLALIGDLILATSPTAAPSTIRSSQNSIITIAGTGAASSTGTGGVATAMTLYNPTGVWLSSMGTVYVVEYAGYCVRKFSYFNGIVFSVAGVSGSSGASGDNGPATSALLNNPSGFVVDTLGVVYIGDSSNHKVRMVSVSGIITTIAGTGSVSNTGDNGPASSAALYYPRGIWMDSLYQLYVVSFGGSTIRRIGSDVNRIISTTAGSSTSASFSGDGGPATSATLSYPYTVFVDSVGVFYIGDSNNNRVRKVTTGGIISTVIGTGITSYNGDQPGTSCNLNNPFGVVLDPSNGDIYVASSNNYLVRVLTGSSGIVSVFAGNQNSAYSGESVAATSAGVRPLFLFLDTSSRLFISDDYNNRVRMTYPTSPTIWPSVAPTAITVGPSVVPSMCPSVCQSLPPSVSTFSVGPTVTPSVMPSVSPSVCPTATTTGPSVLPSVCPSVCQSLTPSVSPFSVGPSVTPSVMPSVRPSVSPSASTAGPSVLPSVCPSVKPSSNPSIMPTILPTSVVPSVMPSYSAAPSISYTPSFNPSTASPSTIRSSQNSIITIAGTGTASSTGTGGVATAMTLDIPYAVWLSSMGTVYVVENSGPCVRKFSYPNGIVFSVAGISGSSGSFGDNGPATSALLNRPYGIVVDTLGVVYLTDYNNNKVRMVSVSGIITTIAGTGTGSNTGDNGPASSAALYSPAGLWMDSLYQLYAVTNNGPTVRRIGSDVNRIISTIAGTGTNSFSGDGGPATSATLNSPYTVFADSVGVFYIGDTVNNRVRRVTTGGIISTVIGTGITSFNGDQPGTSCNLNYPTGAVVDPSNGDIYVASYFNYLVRVMASSSGIVSVFAGNQNSAYSGESVAATSASARPALLFLDTNSRLFISDDYNNRVRMTYPTSPTIRPSCSPSMGQSMTPTSTIVPPTLIPTVLPSECPSVSQSLTPSVSPSSVGPSVTPSVMPSVSPSVCPTATTTGPSVLPSMCPSVCQSLTPSVSPSSVGPSVTPSVMPSVSPSVCPTAATTGPSVLPSMCPSVCPSLPPSVSPSSVGPTVTPSVMPPVSPSVSPIISPSLNPSVSPSSVGPSVTPSVMSSVSPSVSSTISPSLTPSVSPSSVGPSVISSFEPSISPSAVRPSEQPTLEPAAGPSFFPSDQPSIVHSSLVPSQLPTVIPTEIPSGLLSVEPSIFPSFNPSIMHSVQPSTVPSELPSLSPSLTPSVFPTLQPSVLPSVVPSVTPSVTPSLVPSVVSNPPSIIGPTVPSVIPSLSPDSQSIMTNVPTEFLTASPSVTPSVLPSQLPSTQLPSAEPSVVPSQAPSTVAPSPHPTTQSPSAAPSTVDFYLSHPKASLPSNDSISVLGMSDQPFKIVIPFLAINSGSNGMVFDNVVLSKGTIASVSLIPGSLLPVSLSVNDGSINTYGNAVGFDSAMRSVSMLKDVNGDGHNDLIIGDPYAARCYILYGTKLGLRNMTTGFTIFGESEGDLTGWSVSE